MVTDEGISIRRAVSSFVGLGMTLGRRLSFPRGRGSGGWPCVSDGYVISLVSRSLAVPYEEYSDNNNVNFT